MEAQTQARASEKQKREYCSPWTIRYHGAMNAFRRLMPVRGTAGLGLVLGLAASLLTPIFSSAAPRLRYKFEPGRQYVYEVKIVATFEDSTETREGLSYLTVRTAGEQEFTLRHSGNLMARRQTTGGRQPFGRPNFGPMFPWVDSVFARAGEFTVSATGRITKTEVNTSLPYLLGDLEVLSLEELPAEAQSKWEQKHEVVISERERSRFPHPSFGLNADNGVKRSAHETLTYALRQTTGDTVHISKQDTLRADELVDGNPKYQLAGEGELVFDVKQGVFVSQAMKYTLLWNDKNVAIKIPVTVNCRLLDAKETEERLAAAKTAAATAQAAAAKANEPKAFATGEREKLLRDLKAKDEWTVRAAADRLAKAPADDHAEEVAAVLTPLLSDRSNWIRAAAAKALVNWATTNSTPALRAAVGDNDLWLRKAALEALGRFPTPENAQAVAARLIEMSDRADAVKALQAMGPVAEPAVLTYLKDRDMWVRLEACKVLGHIGTAKSLPALEEFGASGQGFDKPESEKSIQAIRARGGS